MSLTFMKLQFKIIFFMIMTLADLLQPASALDTPKQQTNVIIKDICIIGGGSSGTYSAVKLLKAGKSVVVVEKENVLGGHTNTYIDPETNQAIDFGVQAFQNVNATIDYFKLLEIPWEISYNAFYPLVNKTIYVDFDGRKIVENVSYQDPVNGLQAYAIQLAKYRYLEEGFFLPKSIPDDLLLPFGDFAVKYNITSALGVISNILQGIGDILNQPALYVFISFNSNMINDIANGFIVTKNRDNSAIYRNALKFLNDSVLLQSRPIQIDRNSSNGVTVIVQTPFGRKVIRAKKLLVSIPLKLSNLEAFDLTNEEKNIFSKFINAGYASGLVRNTGIADNVLVMNYNPNVDYGLPSLPGVYAIPYTSTNGLFDIKYGSPHDLLDSSVQENIIASLKMLQEIGVANKTAEKPKLVAYSNHTPFYLAVAKKDISKGFYRNLYGLQGRKNTYYTGAGLYTQNSGLLWTFTKDHVLPALIKALN